MGCNADINLSSDGSRNSTSFDFNLFIDGIDQEVLVRFWLDGKSLSCISIITAGQPLDLHYTKGINLSMI